MIPRRSLKIAASLFFLLGTLFGALSAFGEEALKNWSGQSVMNEIKVTDYKGFEKKWNLVTVRHRRDSNEMRFTYANPVAWKAMQSGVKEYPEGSVFAKIGLVVGEDPAFPSSVVPNGARRFQFMKKDKKYKDTDGWGYALFDSSAKTFGEDPSLTAQACHACHRLVPDRGFVFSQPLDFNPFSGNYQPLVGVADSRVQFIDGSVDKLPEKARAFLPEDTRKIRLVVGEIQKKVFEGTLNEIRPALALELKTSGLPAILVSDDQRFVSMVFPAKQVQLNCATKAKASEYAGVVSHLAVDPKDSTKFLPEVRYLVENFCWR